MKVTAMRRRHEGAHDGVVGERNRPQYHLNASSAPAPPPWVNVVMMMVMMMMMHEWVVQVVVAGMMEGNAMMTVMVTMKWWRPKPQRRLVADAGHQFRSVGQRPRFSVSLCSATTREVCWCKEPGVAWSPKWQKKSREAVSPPCIGSHPALSLPRCCHTTPQTNPNKPS